jgi:hypothetical protein
MRLKPIFAAVLSVFAIGAQAGTAFVSQNGGALALVAETGIVPNAYQIGALNTSFSSLFVTLTSAGSFAEFADFSVPSGYNMVNAAANTYTLSILLPPANTVTIGSIGSDFAMSIYGGVAATPGPLLGSVGAGGSLTNLGLSPGNYYLKFTGTAYGVGGQYSAAINALPVPEPETYSMMLAGLGAFGFLARRRRKN